MKHSILGVVASAIAAFAAFFAVGTSAFLRFSRVYDLDYMIPFSVLYKIPNVFFFVALVVGIIALLNKNYNRTWAIVAVSISGYALFRALSWFTIAQFSRIILGY